jgi:D-arabinose 5-phosphate isomerase GutQ
MPPPSPPSPPSPCETNIDNFAPITPPDIQDACRSLTQRLANAVHVLSTEATALSCLTRLYETDPVAREGFDLAVQAICRFNGDRGKLVISGVGKSGHIAKKLVATMNSLQIHATFLHPTEALHGDLGKVGKYDTILLITFSGKTPELLQLIPHFDPTLPIIVMTSHIHPSTCAIVKLRPDTILLPAPIPRSETETFGVSAPTTSTTMALALGDALAVVISDELHPSVAAVFSKNHPGGAIGAAFKGPQKVSDLTIEFEEIPELTEASLTGAHILMSAYQSETGWVRVGRDFVSSPRRIMMLQPKELKELAVDIQGLMVSRDEWIFLPVEMDIPKAREWIRSMRCSGTKEAIKYKDDSILVMIERDEISGIVEVGELMTE